MIGRYLRDESGGAAVEMALVAPFLAGLVMLVIEVWNLGMQTQDMHGALKVASQYYISGGTDDTAARTAAMSAWQHAPSDKSITVTRQCKCGSTVTSTCNVLCSSGDLPAVYVNITASGSRTSRVASNTETATSSVRIR